MQYLALDEEDREAILDYIGEMTLYEEAEADGVSFVLTHSGITGFDPEQPLDEYSPADFLNANPTPRHGVFLRPHGNRRTHADLSAARRQGGHILDDGGIIYIDCGAAHKDIGGRVGCLRLDDFEEFYV